MTNPITETRHAGEFLISEGEGHYSREIATVLSGSGVVVAGTVLAKVTASGKYVPVVDTAADGSQTAVAVLLRGVDATSADAKGAIIARNAEVNGKTLTYSATVVAAASQPAKNTQLAAAGIIVR